MKLISLNVAIFENNNELVRNWLKKQQPDLIALQEVTRRINPNVIESFISKDAIDKGTPNLKSEFYAPTVIVKDFQMPNFHKLKLFKISYGDYLEFGNYIKSRFPIKFGKNIFVQGQYSIKTDWTHFPEEDNRAIQVVDLQISKIQQIRIINYHGIWTKNKLGNEKTVQAIKILSQLASEKTNPCIICGDFNLLPDTQSMKLLDKKFINLMDEYHISTTRPKTNERHHLGRNVIDYIFITKEIKVKDFKVCDINISDHLPLVLEFDLK